MRQLVVSILLLLTFFITACELKEAETEEEKCVKKQRELAIVTIARCGAEYPADPTNYNTCVNISLITLLDDVEQCKK